MRSLLQFGQVKLEAFRAAVPIEPPTATAAGASKRLSPMRLLKRRLTASEPIHRNVNAIFDATRGARGTTFFVQCGHTCDSMTTSLGGRAQPPLLRASGGPKQFVGL